MTGPVLVGSNPGLVWHDAAEEPVAAVSVWDVQWSVRGAGRCVVYWPGGDEVHLLGTDAELSTFLWEELTRHFPEFRWPGEREVRSHVVDVSVELAPGLVTARTRPAPSLTVEIAGLGTEPRLIHVTEFPLGERCRELRNVLFPVDRHRLDTSLPRLETGAGWRGFIALAEVWAD